jgi:CheY-like chemotaxis protein
MNHKDGNRSADAVSRDGVDDLNPQNGAPPIPVNEVEHPHAFGSMVYCEPVIGPPVASTGQQSGSETILFVEDEAFVRRVAAEVLESAGYRVIIAGSATEALRAYCSSDPVDLLVADVILPGMSGRELAAQVETSHPSARVLLMSGYPEQLALCELSAHHRKYLAKPFSIDALLRTVREALDMAPRTRVQA